MPASSRSPTYCRSTRAVPTTGSGRARGKPTSARRDRVEALQPPGRQLAQPLSYRAAWGGTDHFRASLDALCALGQRTGYRLVHTDPAGVNSLFVRSDLVSDKFLPADQVPRRHLANYFMEITDIRWIIDTGSTSTSCRGVSILPARSSPMPDFDLSGRAGPPALRESAVGMAHTSPRHRPMTSLSQPRDHDRVLSGPPN